MKKTLATAAVMASLMFSSSAFAVDGCKVLLCLAGNWKGIAACVPPVREALRDMALGRGYPQCDMNQGSTPVAAQSTPATATGAGNTPTNQSNCPAMYSIYSEENNNWIGCTYTGVISVVVNGQPWTQVYWDGSGNTSTYYSDAARAQLGAQIDPTYDNDLAAWMAANPPAPPVTQTGGGN